MHEPWTRWVALRWGDLDLDNPDPALFADWRNIADNLSRKPRYNGHAISEWTVGKHAILTTALEALRHQRQSISGWVHRDMLLAALHHDDPECVYSDIPSPIGAFIKGGFEFERMRERIGRAVHLRHTDSVKGSLERGDWKVADLWALAVEKHFLFPVEGRRPWQCESLIEKHGLLDVAPVFRDLLPLNSNQIVTLIGRLEILINERDEAAFFRCPSAFL